MTHATSEVHFSQFAPQGRQPPMALAFALRLAKAQYALGQRIGVQFAPPAVGFVVFEQTEQTACVEQVSQPSPQVLHSLPPLASKVAM